MALIDLTALRAACLGIHLANILCPLQDSVTCDIEYGNKCFLESDAKAEDRIRSKQAKHSLTIGLPHLEGHNQQAAVRTGITHRNHVDYYENAAQLAPNWPQGE